MMEQIENETIHINDFLSKELAKPLEECHKKMFDFKSSKFSWLRVWVDAVQLQILRNGWSE